MRQLKKVAHAGCVNRIRSMTQKPHICATWGETGHVQVIQLLPNISFSCCMMVGSLMSIPFYPPAECILNVLCFVLERNGIAHATLFTTVHSTKYAGVGLQLLP